MWVIKARKHNGRVMYQRTHPSSGFSGSFAFLFMNGIKSTLEKMPVLEFAIAFFSCTGTLLGFRIPRTTNGWSNA